MPEAEITGAAQAWEFEAAVRERATGPADRTFAVEQGTRALEAVEVFTLEAILTVQWAVPGDE